MDTPQTNTPSPSQAGNANASEATSASPFAGATELTLLELNNIRLDQRHTILTPDYLEKLVENGTAPTA